MSEISYNIDSNTSFLTADMFDYPTIKKTLIPPSYSTVIERVVYIKSLSSPNVNAGLNIHPVSTETINLQTSNFLSSMYSITLQSVPDAAGGNWGILNRYPDLLNNPAYQVASISSSVNVNINQSQNTSLFFVNVLTSSKTIVLPKISDISPSISTSYTYTIKDLRGASELSSIFVSTSGGDVLENYKAQNVAINDAFGSLDLVANPRTNQWLITNYYSGQLTDNLSVEYPFSYTGADQRLIVPGSITYFRVFLWGAGGGYSTDGATDFVIDPIYGAGGGGGYTTGILPVIPGETLTIMVGQGPGNQDNNSIVRRTTSNFYTSNYSFIYGGGGPGFNGAFGTPRKSPGGGRSAIFRGPSTNLTLELCTAGGGGGGGGFSRLGGGAGGGLIGLRSDGSAQTSSATITSVYGGTGTNASYIIVGGGGQNVGGDGGVNGFSGERGRAYPFNFDDAASGGGGYYGGGTGKNILGGNGGSSGGGSGYIGGLIGGYTEAGSRNIPGGVNVALRPSYVGYGYTPGIARLGHGFVLLKYP